MCHESISVSGRASARCQISGLLARPRRFRGYDGIKKGKSGLERANTWTKSGHADRRTLAEPACLLVC